MIHFAIRFTVAALALLAIAQFVPGISIDSLYVALIAAVVLGVIHMFVKPILFILTLPVTLITFGLFSLVLNAFMFWLAAYILDGFAVSGFLSAFIGSLVLTTVNTIAHKILG